jgi:hypothetical protein
MAASDAQERSELPVPDLAQLGIRGLRGEAKTRRVMRVSAGGLTGLDGTQVRTRETEDSATTDAEGGLVPRDAVRSLSDEREVAWQTPVPVNEAAPAAASEATKAETRLQERLRVGAKMIHACAIQLERLKRAAADATKRETALTALVRDAEARIAEAAREAERRVRAASAERPPAVSDEPAHRASEVWRDDQMTALAATMRQLADRVDAMVGSPGDRRGARGAKGPGDDGRAVEIVTGRGLKLKKN